MRIGRLKKTVPVLLAVFAPHARAAERVILSNGFSITCDHHAQVDDKTRLFLSAGEDSFIEFPSQEVAAVEQMPDSAPPVIAPALATKSDGTLNAADLAEILANAGKEHNLDVDLLASVVKAESDGNQKAISPAGARGLMQLMPQTASELGVKDSFEARQNVRGGSAYLDSLLVRYRDNLSLALAAYNAGPAAVDKYRGIPPYRETQAYVARVIHEFNRRVLAREADTRRAASAAQSALSSPLSPSRP